MSEQIVLKSRKAFDQLTFKGYEKAEAAKYFSEMTERDRKARSAYHERNEPSDRDCVKIDKFYGMYDTLHEADVSLFVEIMDADGHNIVVINDIVFKGRRGIDWQSVKNYVKQYVGCSFKILESSDVVFI